jgi:hypothetical protein
MSPRKKIRKARLPFINFDIQTNLRQLKTALTTIAFILTFVLCFYWLNYFVYTRFGD